jgi:hypothetical protein
MKERDRCLWCDVERKEATIFFRYIEGCWHQSFALEPILLSPADPWSVILCPDCALKYAMLDVLEILEI